MLSCLLKQNWIGIDDFLLNFFATFVSGLRLQNTVTFGSVLDCRLLWTADYQWIAITDVLGAICCKHNAASP